MASSSSSSSPIYVMVNGVSGKMGHATATSVVKRPGYELVPYALTKRAKEPTDVEGVAVEGIVVGESGEDAGAVLERAKKEYPGLVVVDYTLPESVNENAALYVAHGVPFVMGTTGGDREKMLADVEKSGNYAVIAPQMGKQVVAFQAMMQRMSEMFPGAFNDYTLSVVESHQKTKVDTSGTAKAIVESFRALGVQPFDDDDIELVRNPNDSVDRMGVPETYLDGHAYHTYRLTSPDGTVAFEFQHNVNGRAIYAQGTVDAVLFLHRQLYGKPGGATQKLYDMIDVLEAGVMR